MLKIFFVKMNNLMGSNYYPSLLVEDIQKLLIAYIFEYPENAIKMAKIYKNSSCNYNINGNDESLVENYVVKYLPRSYLTDNKALLEALWLRYVSKILPEYKNFSEFKSLYVDAIELYLRPYNEILKMSIKNKYEIIYNNAVNIDYLNKNAEYITNDQYMKILRQIPYPNQIDENADNLLQEAIVYQDYEVIKYLIDKGVNVNVDQNINIKFKPLNTPLRTAVMSNKVKIVNLLLSRGADVNTEMCHGTTILMDACDCQNFEMVEILINNGAFVNEQNKFGRTAMSYSWDNPEIIRFLLLNGYHEDQLINNDNQ